MNGQSDKAIQNAAVKAACDRLAYAMARKPDAVPAMVQAREAWKEAIRTGRIR